MLKVTVKNFGPIKEGSVSLRPLTVLIGPNNAGKSYIARLVYAVQNALGQPKRGAFRHPIRFPRGLVLQLPAGAMNWLYGRIGKGEKVSFNTSPPDFQQGVTRWAKKFLRERAAALGDEVRRCFGAKLSGVATAGSGDGFRLALAQSNPSFRLELALGDEEFRASKLKCDLTDVELISGPTPGMPPEISDLLDLVLDRPKARWQIPETLILPSGGEVGNIAGLQAARRWPAFSPAIGGDRAARHTGDVWRRGRFYQRPVRS